MHHIKELNLAMLAAALALGGCSTPHHTDLLVFGTNTQFGVSASAEATANPGVTIGFRRQELVLMPLYVNGTDSKFPPKEVTGVTNKSIAAAKYQGTDGQDGGRSDTYSVLASFGASGSGGAQAGEGKVSIAQYFATGLAARTLAVAGGTLVSTSDKTAEASKVTSVQAAKVDPAVKSLKAADTRFSSEATLTDGYAKLTSEQKIAYLKALNEMFTQVNGAALTDGNFQQSLQFFKDPQLEFAQSELTKL